MRRLLGVMVVASPYSAAKARLAVARLCLPALILLRVLAALSIFRVGQRMGAHPVLYF